MRRCDVSTFRCMYDGKAAAGRSPLCSLYSMTKSQEAMRSLAKVLRDKTGNLPPLPGIFPDYPAPIVRNRPEGRELVMARWGMPSPAFALKGKNADYGVTNIRNVKSPHWRRWLGIGNRCLVPFCVSACNFGRRSGVKVERRLTPSPRTRRPDATCRRG